MAALEIELMRAKEGESERPREREGEREDSCSNFHVLHKADQLLIWLGI